MNVDWIAANRLYLETFGEPLAVRVCQDEIARLDDGERSDEEILFLLEQDEAGLSKGQLDCLAACLV